MAAPAEKVLPPVGVGVGVIVLVSLFMAWVLGLRPQVPAPESGMDFWLPMGFLIAGILLFLWELSMPGFFVAVAGTICMVLGIIGMVFEGFFTEGGPIAPLLTGVVVGIPASIVTLKLYRFMAPPDALPTTMSGDTMRGRAGTVTVAVDPETTRGKVRVEGTVWSAKSEQGTIPEGTRVVVKEARGVHILVAPEQQESQQGASATDATQESTGGPEAGGRSGESATGSPERG